MAIHEEQSDHVDEIIVKWSKVKPDLDVSPIGIVGRICRLAMILVKTQTRVFERYNLDSASFDVLATLYRNGPFNMLTPGHLARSMMITPGAVTQRLTHLENRGLLVRTHNTDDRRIVTVQLTDEGRLLLEAAFPDHLDSERRILAQFNNAELEGFSSLLRRMLVSMGDLPA